MKLQIPPSVIPVFISEPDILKTLPKTTPIPESDIPKSLPKPNIPYPSRRDDQKSRDKALNQMEKIFQIFQDLHFDISFADALLLMPRFAPTIKSFLMNKEKLLELAKILGRALSTFSAEEIVPIPRESEDTSGSDSKNVLPSYDDFSSINVPRDDSSINDEIDAFLAIEVPTYIGEGYYDSKGDVIYHESLLSDDTTHNLFPEVFFDHEPQHKTFSPKSDPLHHEFTGELIMIHSGIVREHENYINRMSLLCGNSSSRSPENSHTIIESLPTSTTLIKDSDSNREEIDIFSGLDDSIPPGIESDFDSEEDIIDNLLTDDHFTVYERLTFDMEPDVLMINNVNKDECFDPGGGEINVEVDDSFTFVTWIFISYLTYPEVRIMQISQENGQKPNKTKHETEKSARDGKECKR
ncbi:hypothetical protein Tco_1549313 [Tanacetum coccineum]